MNQIIGVFGVLLFICFGCKNESVDQSVFSVKDRLRPVVQEYFGEEWARKILGNPPGNEILLPLIPKIHMDAVDLSIYKNRPQLQGKIKISADQKMKYDYLFILEIYQAIRGIHPDSGEIARWQNAMNQGASREGVYHGLVLSSEYGALENYQQELKSSAVEFSTAFGEKFLGMKIKASSLVQMNIYSIKRILTEKALEIMDEYIRQDKYDECYRWYAVTSQYLAENHAPLWRSELRKNTSSKFHYFWVQEVPLQFAKGEMIIKIHTVLNQWK